MVSEGCGSNAVGDEAVLFQQLIDLVTVILLLEGQLRVVGVDIARGGTTLQLGGPALQLDVDTIAMVRS